jgi:tRNA-modifying protein YgfZ
MIHLNWRSVIKLSGKDVVKFLQGIATADIEKLSENNPVYTLFLTPQGKFLYDAFIVAVENDYYLDIAKDSATEFISHLKKYKLRSDVSISEPLNEFKIGWTLFKPTKSIVYKDPRHPDMGYRAIFSDEITYEEVEKYHNLRFRLKIPENIIDLTPNDAFPLQYGMDRLGAIDFNKGCYIGQEVTTRTKHKGGVRKSVYYVEIYGEIAKYDELYKNNELVGVMLSFWHNTGLALLQNGAVAQNDEIFSKTLVKIVVLD